GSVVCLIVCNGAGKTMTFSMMAGYLRPTAGRLEVLGHAPTAVDELRSRVGVLPQDAALPSNDEVGELLVHLARLQNVPRRKAIDTARAALAESCGSGVWEQRFRRFFHGL